MGMSIVAAWGAVSAAPATEPPAAQPPTSEYAAEPTASPITVASGISVPPSRNWNTTADRHPDRCLEPIGCRADRLFLAAGPVAFVGTLATSDATTVACAADPCRSLDGYTVETIVDIRYDDDIRFLHPGAVSGRGDTDPVTGVLRSGASARPCSGDADWRQRHRCQLPTSRRWRQDPARQRRDVTLGAGPLKTSKKSVAKAFLKPAAVAFAIWWCWRR